MRCEERSGHVEKRMRQLTTLNSTLLFKYTHTLCTCMCHEEIHAQKWDMYKHIRITHMYAVYSTQHWILFPVAVQEHVVINMES